MGVEGVAEICCATKEAALRNKASFVAQENVLRCATGRDEMASAYRPVRIERC